jgi:hypothetical protein
VPWVSDFIYKNLDFCFFLIKFWASLGCEDQMVNVVFCIFAGVQLRILFWKVEY